MRKGLLHALTAMSLMFAAVALPGCDAPENTEVEEVEEDDD